MGWRIWFGVGCLALLICCGCGPRSLDPGEVAALREALPQQSSEGADDLVWSRKDSSVRLQRLAEYSVLARVMARSRYRFDQGARYAPVDLALAWGPVADPAYDSRIDWSQGNRFYFYRYRSMPDGLTKQMIRTSSANTHIIPMDTVVRRSVLKVRRGDIVRLQGWLVSLREEWEDGRWYQWKSSLTRNDDGAGACELLLVSSVEINPPLG